MQPPRHRLPSFVVLVLSALVLAGCQNEQPRFVSMGTAPVGGTFPVVGGALAEVLNRHRGQNDWKVQIKGSKGSQENIRRLASGQFELGLSNAAISYFAARGQSGWEQKYDVRAVATMAPLVAMFIAKQDSGIQSVKDLEEKRVVIGPAGAGFDMFVRPILEAHGVAWDSFDPVFAPQGVAVDMLADGAADAAFLGGALPAQSILQAASSFSVYFVPFDPAAKQKLLEYPFFKRVPYDVVQSKYEGKMHYPLEDEIKRMDLEELRSFVAEKKLPVKLPPGDPLPKQQAKVIDGMFGWLNVGSMQVVTYKNADKRLIKEITRTMWNHRQELAEMHPAFKFLDLKAIPLPTGARKIIQGATMHTGIEFHPGAVEFYQEIQLQQEPGKPPLLVAPRENNIIAPPAALP